MSEQLRNMLNIEGQSREIYIGNAIERAIKLREHPAAVRTPHGVGMVTPYRIQDDKLGMYNQGLAAVLVTHAGKIIVENHITAGVPSEMINGKFRNACRTFELGDTDLTPLGAFPASRTPTVHAWYFDKDIEAAMGDGFQPGAVDTISEGCEVLVDLLFTHDHSFTSPLIEELVSIALPQET